MHARYYTFNLGRFMSVDPVGGTVGLSQSWNRYAYVRGNPVNTVDPDGRTTLVFIVAPGGMNDTFSWQGHAAVFVQRDERSAGISFGGDAGFDKGVRGFIRHYTSQGREVRMYVLGTSARQDNAMIDLIKSHPAGGIDSDSKWREAMYCRENCTTAVGNVLEAGGVVGHDSNPGRGAIADRPANLRKQLENGSLHALVTVIHVFEPQQKKEESKDDEIQVINEEVIRFHGRLQFRAR
jgi:uncharacterized protein RhaS with RHS repeats